MASISHRVRNSILSEETEFTLSAVALTSRSAGGSKTIPYADIDQLNLLTYAG